MLAHFETDEQYKLTKVIGVFNKFQLVLENVCDF